MVDAGGWRRFPDGGFAVKRDAEAGCLDHGNVVGAIADSQRLLAGEM